MKILVVDDDIRILEILPMILSSEGMREIVCSESSEDALTAVKKASPPFDCFIFDISMPGLSGVDLCRQVRALKTYKATPILMLTSLRDEESMREALNAGANDYITKPFDVLEIGVRINMAYKLVMAREKISALSERYESDHPNERRGKTSISREEIMNLFASDLYKTGSK